LEEVDYYPFYISMNIKRLEKSAALALKNLRLTKLQNGLPFMINSDLLPSNQCYLEYPDGSIALVFLNRKMNDFKTITEYSSEQADLIRKQFKLP
jgi:hypothetical protein